MPVDKEENTDFEDVLSSVHAGLEQRVKDTEEFSPVFNAIEMQVILFIYNRKPFTSYKPRCQTRSPSWPAPSPRSLS